MKNLLKIMTAIIQRLRRKRRLSSELDPRWGDTSISYPNAGSWNQYDQVSPRASPASARSSDHDHHHKHAHGPKRSSGDSAFSDGGNPESTRKTSADSAMPTGYYDARVRRRCKTKAQAGAAPERCGQTTLPKGWEDGDFADSSTDEDEDDDAVHALESTRGRRRRADGDGCSRPSKSPPLSVTSRMRKRYSGQRSTVVTDPMGTVSMPGTASSRRTSFSSEDPRLARHIPQHDKKKASPPQRARTRDPNAILARQELVPSYDELYG